VKLDEALAGARRPTILRNLRIDDVSSVDRGAGRGVKVVLTKREGKAMSKGKAGFAKCPMCKGHGYIGADDEVEKGADFETVHKAVQLTHRSIAEEVMKRNPGMSFDRAMRAATSTPEYSELVRDERRRRLGY
jgi:hypothetical protein